MTAQASAGVVDFKTEPIGRGMAGDRPIVVEVWNHPDGTHVLEVSTKGMPKEAFEVAVDFNAYLARQGIVLGADQSVKTRTSLELFSTRLEEEGQAGREGEIETDQGKVPTGR